VALGDLQAILFLAFDAKAFVLRVEGYAGVDCAPDY
jgi:hypothetical protein